MSAELLEHFIWGWMQFLHTVFTHNFLSFDIGQSLPSCHMSTASKAFQSCFCYLWFQTMKNIYSLMNMRQLHILFNSAKTWHVIVCWFLCFAPNLPELNLKLFWTSEQNNFRFSSGKFGGKHRNQQTIPCQVLA